MQKYSLIWKGGELGKFTRAEIESKFARGEIGMLYSVRHVNGSLVGVGEFLNSEESEFEEKPSNQINREFDFATFGFVMGGMSFLSVYVCITSLIFALFLVVSDRKSLAMNIAIISISTGLLGFFFFSQLLPKI